MTSALSPREQEMVELVCLGMSNRDIAAYLYLSPHTVRFYLWTAYDKLGVKGRRGGRGEGTRIQAIGAFWRQGWRP